MIWWFLAPPRRNSGTILGELVIETEQTFVAQTEQGRRGETLGHRCDPEQRVNIWRTVSPPRSMLPRPRLWISSPSLITP